MFKAPSALVLAALSAPIPVVFTDELIVWAQAKAELMYKTKDSSLEALFERCLIGEVNERLTSQRLQEHGIEVIENDEAGSREYYWDSIIDNSVYEKKVTGFEPSTVWKNSGSITESVAHWNAYDYLLISGFEREAMLLHPRWVIASSACLTDYIRPTLKPRATGHVLWSRKAVEAGDAWELCPYYHKPNIKKPPEGGLA